MAVNYFGITQSRGSSHSPLLQVGFSSEQSSYSLMADLPGERRKELEAFVALSQTPVLYLAELSLQLVF